MKTSVMLKSRDRQLFGITVRQNTKEHFLSVTDLQAVYDKGRWMHGWTGQTIAQVMQTDNFSKKCFGVLDELKFVKCDFSTFMNMVENEGISKVLKGLGVYKTTGRGANKTVMANPYIWMTIALELNYILYGKVIVWLTDSLVFDRIEAGTEYMPMNAAIKAVLKNPDYPKYAKAINIRVFGHHQTGMRNIASSKELRKIADIEKFIINAIELGWLKTEDTILKAIQNYK